MLRFNAKQRYTEFFVRFVFWLLWIVFSWLELHKGISLTVSKWTNRRAVSFEGLFVEARRMYLELPLSKSGDAQKTVSQVELRVSNQ